MTVLSTIKHAPHFTNLEIQRQEGGRDGANSLVTQGGVDPYKCKGTTSSHCCWHMTKQGCEPRVAGDCSLRRVYVVEDKPLAITKSRIRRRNQRHWNSQPL